MDCRAAQFSEKYEVRLKFGRLVEDFDTILGIRIYQCSV